MENVNSVLRNRNYSVPVPNFDKLRLRFRPAPNIDYKKHIFHSNLFYKEKIDTFIVIFFTRKKLIRSSNLLLNVKEKNVR